MRSFSPSFGLSLPSMALPEAVRLARALVAAASLMAPQLPPLLRLSEELLSLRLRSLMRLLGASCERLHAPESEIDRAERRLARTWEAFFDWLSGLSGLSSRAARSHDALALLQHLFPDGMSLVRPPPMLAWAESEARIGAIEREGFALAMCAAGGAPFLEAIVEAQAAFGEALQSEEGGALSSAKQARLIRSFALALHAYLAALSATMLVDEAEPSSLASSLLAPLAHFTREAEPIEPIEPSPTSPPLEPFEPFEPFEAAWEKEGLAA